MILHFTTFEKIFYKGGFAYDRLALQYSQWSSESVQHFVELWVLRRMKCVSRDVLVS